MSKDTKTTSKKEEKAKAKYIVRTLHAGVFFGEIAGSRGLAVNMRNVRKIWSWHGACAVEELAKSGVQHVEGTKLTVQIQDMVVFNPIQIIPCTKEAVASLERVPEWKASK